MRLRSSLGVLLLAAASAPAAGVSWHYRAEGEDPGSWPAVLASIGLAPGAASGGVCILRKGPASHEADWRARVEQGAFLVLEGESELASVFGFRPGKGRVAVRSVRDRRSPGLPIVWEHALTLPVFDVPPGAEVFAAERWTGAPLVAGLRLGAGGVLWAAADPGPEGHERFPYLVHALADLGLRPPFRSRRLWAFLDTSYRTRVDLAYFARRWREAGIAALHVAAWHYWESDPEQDARLRELIEHCHREAIQVYAWLEFPHVSERFWSEHPEWRERTATLQDAHLDWRKLMNLADPDCARAVAGGLRDLAARHDWDGINLAELYFESLEGAANPARFTPMNATVREEFRARHGFDPIRLFDGAGRPGPKQLQTFLGFRADLARRLQEQWIGEIEALRRGKPHLELVLTHVDDRLDTRMRDLIGADAERLLGLLDSHSFQFLIEDPATVWNLGPGRYPQIASRYLPLTSRPDRLAIDINVVERYQDVYPTRRQTGAELLRQVHLAALSFPRVALYAEHSLAPADLPLLASAAAAVKRAEWREGELVVDSKYGVGVPWEGPVLVDGRPWPVTDGRTVWLPAGAHSIRGHAEEPDLHLTELNADLRSARALPRGIEFSYQSGTRAFAVLDAPPARVEIDGAPAQVPLVATSRGIVLPLPRGQHLVELGTDPPFR